MADTHKAKTARCKAEWAKERSIAKAERRRPAANLVAARAGVGYGKAQKHAPSWYVPKRGPNGPHAETLGKLPVIFAMRSSGATFQAIGDSLTPPITGEAVRQFLKKYSKCQPST